MGKKIHTMEELLDQENSQAYHVLETLSKYSKKEGTLDFYDVIKVIDKTHFMQEQLKEAKRYMKILFNEQEILFMGHKISPHTAAIYYIDIKLRKMGYNLYDF